MKLSNFEPGEDSFGGDIVELVQRARRPRDPWADFAYLADSRAETVRRHRAPGPHGGVLGPWYRAQDWDDAGNLVATGRAAAMALDPWTMDRADRVAGRPAKPTTMPPIQPLRFEGVEYPDIEPVANKQLQADTGVADVAISRTERPVLQLPAVESELQDDDARKAAQAVKMRQYRAAKEAGLSMAAWREQQGLPPVRRGRKAKAAAPLPSNVVRLVPRIIATAVASIDAPIIAGARA